MNTQKKIPTLLGLFIIGVFLVVLRTIALVFSSTTQTGDPVEPRDIQLSNIETTKLTLTWISVPAATGFVEIIHPDGKKLRYYNNQDTEKKLTNQVYHSVTIPSLSPDTSYKALIYSNGKIYPINKRDGTIKTAKDIGTNQNGLAPAYGTILGKDTVPVKGALVLLTTEGGQLLSTLTKDDGGWLIPLDTLRTETLESFLPVSEKIEQTVTAYYANDLAFAKTDTLNNAPVGHITIGKTFDYRKQTQKKLEISVASPANELNEVLGEQIVLDPKKVYPVTISQPLEGASLVSNIPLLQGTAVPGKQITLTIGIKNPKTHTVIVNTDGLWRFTPLEPLGIGKQSVTITTMDKNDKPIAITHTFDVLKSGTQVLGIATPSATLAPQSSPTPTVVVPSQSITITSTPVLPTNTPTPTRTPTPTPTVSTNEPPVSGNSLPTLLIIAGSVLLLSAGVFGLVKS